MKKANTSKKFKINNLLKLLLFIFIVVSFTYLLVYRASLLPNGYDLVSEQERSISLKSFNALGLEEGSLTKSFSEEDIWKMNEIVHEINRQKEFLWLLFSAIIISIYLYTSKLRKVIEISYPLLGSTIVIGVFLPLYNIINSINRIQYLIT
jgi:hypothetical protein